MLNARVQRLGRWHPGLMPALARVARGLAGQQARCDDRSVQASGFDEPAFFLAIARSGARALLIGRRALVALGLPVLTVDYDFWIHVDDAAPFNQAAARFGLQPNRTPADARSVGRYVLENDEKVDVLVAKVVHTVDGEAVHFDDLWSRRRQLEVAPGVLLGVPRIADLILTKRFGARPRDADDIRLLQVLREREGE